MTWRGIMVRGGGRGGMVVQVIGLTNAQRALRQARLATQHLKPMLEKIVIILQQSTDKTFRMGGRPKWPLSERAKEQSGQTLLDKRRLHLSVAARPVVKIGRDRLEYGTRLKKAPSLHYGYPERNIPPRPYLGIYPEDEKKIEQVIGQDISNAWQVGSGAGGLKRVTL
jgi:phage gpG-like protein